MSLGRRAIHSLIALTGNVDVKGGNLLFDHSRLPVASAALEPRITLPKEEMEKAPGVKERPMFYGKDALIFSHSHPPAFFDMLHSGEPYKVKFLLSVSDPVMGLQDTRKIRAALKSVDFFVDIDFFMTPTANLADLVLPAATYLERDLRQISQIDSLLDFRRLMQLTALRSGQLLNQSELARDARISQPTTHRYLNLLETTHLFERLPAYLSSHTTRLLKSPKVFWNDTGLAVFLSGYYDIESLKQSREYGAYFETLIYHH